MSQQIMPIVSLGVTPVIDMGDLEYIEGKVLAGNYFQVSGDISADSSFITITVPNTKTAFMIEAKIVPLEHVNGAIGGLNATINNNNRVQAVFQFLTSGPTTTIKDTANVGNLSTSYNKQSGGSGATVGGGGNGNQNKDSFNVLGLSLVGDGVDTKIQIQNSLDNGSAFATMSGYLVDT